MSVAEIKAQAATLSFEELSDLARHLRALTLRKDPQRLAQLQTASQSDDWLVREDFERELDQLDRGDR